MVNPLIVYPKQDKTIEDFCREHQLRFEVVEGRIAQASQKIQNMTQQGKHTSVMLSYYMPSAQWELMHKEEDIKCSASSDLSYMLDEQGNITIPASRLPQHPQIALRHLQQIQKEYPLKEEKQKITILYAMPNVDAEIQQRGRFLLQNNTTRRIFNLRFGATMRTLIPELEDISPDDFQRTLRESTHPHIKAFLELYALKNIIDGVESQGYEVWALPDIPTQGRNEWDIKALAHIANSSLIFTLDYQPPSIHKQEDSKKSAIHSNGERLVQEKGTVILSRDQLKKIEFPSYPLLWLGGCHSSSPRFTQVITQAGASFVGNSNYGYSLPWDVYRNKEQTFGLQYHSFDEEILSFLQENKSLGETHVQYLRTLAKHEPRWKELSQRILHCEPITAKIPEDRIGIELLNKSRLWGNAEARSPLYKTPPQ